uniref:Uncharacterized protein n=1 Tax=Anopheles minimus TaxID=112268 RepID=A0A182WQ13_9DIPT
MHKHTHTPYFKKKVYDRLVILIVKKTTNKIKISNQSFYTTVRTLMEYPAVLIC